MHEETIKSLKKYIAESLEQHFDFPEADFSFEPTRNISDGDYATNVAFVLSKKTGKSPREIADELVARWKPELHNTFSNVEAAGAGFINFHFSKEYFENSIRMNSDHIHTEYTGKKIIVDYTDPNLFKQFHIGHLMANTVGESLSRLYELAGAKVTRICYQGDIGPHVAKCIWGMIQNKDAFPVDEATLASKIKFMGDSYVYGAKHFKENPEVETEIKDINKKLFEKSDAELQKYYDLGRKWSLDYFDGIYEILGTKFDHFFFETQTGPIGERIVRENISNGVFEKSDESDAIVYKGEQDGLHTRVFLNSQGLPTYEAKDLGLARLKSELDSFDRSIIVTGLEQTEYFKVMLAALSKINSEQAKSTFHIAHGLMLHNGKKMSSREGALLAEDLINDIKVKVFEKLEERDFDAVEKEKLANFISLAALKYSILKQTPGKNIVFDFEKSISFEGDSGPYLQYACVRANSLLAKAGSIDEAATNKKETYAIEKVLVRFESVLARAIAELAPQHIAGYLIELASEFNSWYAAEKIIGDENEAYKLLIVRKFAQTLKKGLFGLGIEVPSKM